jgi:hypothetical protein
MLSCVIDAIIPQRNYPQRVQLEKQAVAQSKTATRSGKSRRSSSSTKKSTKTASRKAKASPSKGRTTSRSKATREAVAVIDRRRAGRRGEDRGESGELPVLAAPKLERRKKVNRRRQIDPTTCERDYSDDEIQFMNALDAYKRASGRMFPTCSEVLEVLRTLGYVRLSSAETKAYEAPAPASSATPTDSTPVDTNPSP